jgi:hypothetical protein
VTQAIECLFCKCEALSSNCSPTKKKKKTKNFLKDTKKEKYPKILKKKKMQNYSSGIPIHLSVIWIFISLMAEGDMGKTVPSPVVVTKRLDF